MNDTLQQPQREPQSVMTADGLEVLRQIALSATPGPWLDGNWFGVCNKDHKHGSNDADACQYSNYLADGGNLVAAGSPEAPLQIIGNREYTGATIDPKDKAFIVAFNPAVVLQMISALQKASAIDANEVRRQALEEAAVICDEMNEHWSGYKDTALINGDVALSNSASGEPRAAQFLAERFRALAQERKYD